ncbi:unnamed protein product, partial [Durusdinium trenchii]
QTSTLQCGSLASGYLGDITLTCNEGVITADLSACKAPCPAAAVSVSFASAPHSVSTTAEILHGQTGSVGCNTADTGFTGSIVLSCTDGVLSQSSETCAERACEEDLGYELHLGGQSASRTLAAEVAHGQSVTSSCSSVKENYDHDITVTCIKGGLSADYSACVLACLTSDTADVTLGPTTHTVSPAARMAEGETATKQCSDLGAHYTGTMQVSCSAGTVSVVSSCSVGCAATDTAQVFNSDVPLGAILADGATATLQDCPGAYVGDFTAS